MLASIGLAVLLSTSGCAPQAHVTLSDILSNSELEHFTAPIERTADLCGQIQGCVEAWSTQEATFRRFDDVAAASRYSAEVGADAFQSRYITIDFRGSAVSEAERRSIEEVIEGAHQSD
ncbi:MAG: hypothetical protein P0Y48_11805 [Candidatus Microbacterium phytovorans]|uniref:Uncharacterized protein n=1 Tax=Candidatus Microbacterium phytovorans TaxID=3121374 RepID=A0AAJ5W1J1_9MICO|nr:hypothetical protein [Microbacterium sp.]WEK13138.1 MAG: hypothetical protein P0Y48_11805 [Microbacterium sp.]